MNPNENNPEKVYVYPASSIGRPCFDEDELDLAALWQLVWRGKNFIILFTLLCTLAAGLVSFFVLPEKYESSATLILVEQNESTLRGLSSIVGNLPLPISLPGRGSSNIKVFLDSRTLKERLITKYDLLPVFYEDLWDSENKTWFEADSENTPTLVRAIQGNLINKYYSINQDKKTEIITITWLGKDPVAAKNMLLAIINELSFYLENDYVSDAKHEREFVENLLVEATEELEFWEKQVPSKTLTLSKITREQFASQTIYTELRKQLELARINEAKELESFKVLDQPFIPEAAKEPKKILIVVLAMVMAGFISIFILFLRNFLQNAKENDKVTD